MGIDPLLLDILFMTLDDDILVLDEDDIDDGVGNDGKNGYVGN